MNFITGSVHINLRFTASWLLNMRRATLSLMITTFSLSDRSSALKSRPAMIGTPSDLKNPGDTVRKLARGSSSPSAFGVALGRELRVEERAGFAPRHDRADRDLSRRPAARRSCESLRDRAAASARAAARS